MEPIGNALLVSAAELAELEDLEVQFYLDPWIPAEGIVFLYGKFGTFKTPITYHMALGLAQGKDVLGMSVPEKIPVLYVEADSPRIGIQKRFKRLNHIDADMDTFFCYPGLNFLNQSTDRDSKLIDFLREKHRARKYKVVFLDALRGLHTKDDKESTTATEFYRKVIEIFPDAAVVIVHHSKKDRADQTDQMKTESFSGTQAWINHATVAIQVSLDNNSKSIVTLTQEKSQVGEKTLPVKIRVLDGTEISLPNEVRNEKVAEVLDDLPTTMTAHGKDEKLAEVLGISIRTATRRRLEYEKYMVDALTAPLPRKQAPSKPLSA